MEPVLTEQKLVESMKAYLKKTPHAVLTGGFIWTSPELVRRFASGLGDALADTIFRVIGPPPDADAVEVTEVKAGLVVLARDHKKLSPDNPGSSG